MSCEDAPCCGCCGPFDERTFDNCCPCGDPSCDGRCDYLSGDYFYDDNDLDESMDGDFDSGMASAGFGMDEDYGCYDCGDDAFGYY